MANETLSDVLAGDGDERGPHASHTRLRPVLLILDG
jgi:hypothetical protein